MMSAQETNSGGDTPAWFAAFVESCKKEKDLRTLDNVKEQCIYVHSSKQMLGSVHPLIVAKYLHFAEAQFNLGIHN